MTIVGTNLPGRQFAVQSGGGAGTGYENVCVAVQRGRDHEQVQPGDEQGVEFQFDVTPVSHGDARGPYVHGRKGERFIYLCWLADPQATMFRRLKLMLANVPPSVWDAAVAEGRLRGELGLTDRAGGPRCARVAGSEVSWSTPPP